MQYNNNLEYQNEVTNIIGDIFNVPNLFLDAKNYNSNPLINLTEDNKTFIKSQINKYNKKLDTNLQKDAIIDNYINIDVKMETGTGKTYVYTETIHALHQQLGVAKFIG